MVHKKNIIHVTPYFPPSIGGMETVAYQVANKLSLKDYKVTVITSKVKNNANKVRDTSNLKIKYLTAFEIFNTQIIFNLLGNLFKIPKNSIIHLHVAHMLTPEITYIAAKFRNIPYIAHVHGDITSYSPFFNNVLSFYKKSILRNVIINAKYIVVPTQDYISFVSETFNVPKEKITVIPSALNIKVKKHIMKKLNSPIKLLFVGRLVEQKNPLLLIKVIKKLKEENITVMLTIVGEGNLKDQIATEIKNNNLEKDITLQPFTIGDKLNSIYSLSDILLLPSHWETFGTVIIESMSLGTPVIAHNISGVKNIITNRYNGLLVNNTVEGFYNAIKNLSMNKNFYNELVRNGLNEAKKYELDTVILSYEDLYKKI